MEIKIAARLAYQHQKKSHSVQDKSNIKLGVQGFRLTGSRRWVISIASLTLIRKKIQFFRQMSCKIAFLVGFWTILTSKHPFRHYLCIRELLYYSMRNFYSHTTMHESDWVWRCELWKPSKYPLKYMKIPTCTARAMESAPLNGLTYHSLGMLFRCISSLVYKACA